MGAFTNNCVQRVRGAYWRFATVRQAEIKALFEEADFLSPRSRSRSLSYIEEFFETISDDRRVERGTISKCREPSI